MVDEQQARGVQKYANISAQSGDDKLLPDFDPVALFIRDLRVNMLVVLYYGIKTHFVSL